MIKFGRFSANGWAEQQYNEAIMSAASYNNRLNKDCKTRLPYLDFHTGLAQNHSKLWVHPRYRSPGKTPGQLYSYPAFRWRKKKRFISLPVPLAKTSDVEVSDLDAHKVLAVENVTMKPSHDGSTRSSDVLTNEYVTEDTWDDVGESLDTGEIDDPNSDNSDYEELYIKRKKKKASKKATPARSKASKTPKAQAAAAAAAAAHAEPRGGGGGSGETSEETDKKYNCEICGARYKTKPGLSYHVSHSHSAKLDECEEATSSSTVFEAAEPVVDERPTGSGKKVSKYCDFCLGDEGENKKTGLREELVSCADCGRSGHPSCLQFTANMMISVKKYPWQCIECKSCGLCGTSDNDEQLLFCDDCDRGYHMYCLQPPLTEPPEGSWSCHLCVREFHSHLRPPMPMELGPSVVQL